ncbi:MAG: hypothetical protein HFJ09_08430 [Lachnospiraceae bacterium]|nr:hypothetical protein [Lachnospiraceae bacterium]
MNSKFLRKNKGKMLILLGLFCITLSGFAISSQLNFNHVEASSESTPFESIQPTTTPTPPKPAGTSLTAYSTKNGLILRWKKIEKNNSGYEIQYATNKNFKSKKSAWVKNNTKSSKTIKNLKKNTKYYVRIRTYNQTEQKKIYGGFSKIVSMTTAADVTFLYKEGFYCEKISNSTKKRMTGKSYTKNNYVQLSDLRYVRVQHYDYKGKIQSGELVVNKKIANNTVKVFYELFQKKYPIQRMKLIDDYGADDETSMEANNTSAFNFRNVSGSSNLSKHAYGLAIDINPKINPYIKGSIVLPKNGKSYIQRDVSKCKGKYKSNMIHKNDVAYKIFTKYGFQWGGNWNSLKDYQHFEAK